MGSDRIYGIQFTRYISFADLLTFFWVISVIYLYVGYNNNIFFWYFFLLSTLWIAVAILSAVLNEFGGKVIEEAGLIEHAQITI